MKDGMPCRDFVHGPGAAVSGAWLAPEICGYNPPDVRSGDRVAIRCGYDTHARSPLIWKRRRYTVPVEHEQ